MQCGGHVDAGVVIVGALETDVFGVCIGPDPFQEIAEAHTKGTDILLSGDFVVLPDYRLGGYLRVSEPTDS